MNAEQRPAKRGTGWSSAAAIAKCPFYRSNNDKYQTITCEGVCGAMTVRLTFKAFRTYAEQLRKCCDIEPDCPINRAVMEKYEGLGNG